MFTEPPILKRDIWISHPHHFVVFTLYITKKLNYTFHIILLGIPERFIRIRVSLVRFKTNWEITPPFPSVLGSTLRIR